ncbi:MAG: alpha/beta fold hydrolase [Cyclobacteriaceae bacterium]
MTGNYHQFQHQGAVLGYLQAGNGPEHLLIFHGFGQDHTAFHSLANELDEKFTLYSFDLFFHGKSQWPHNETPLSKAYWKELLGQFLKEKVIKNFSVMGFSLGGKFALATIEAFPSKISSTYLLAPDGIKTNIWYSLATYPVALRWLFKSMILKPGRFQAIVRGARKLHLVDRGVSKFAESQMNTEEKRKRVYYSWVVFRQLKFDLNNIASLIISNKINLYVFVGRFDKIITAKNMALLLHRVPDHHFQILETGHNGLIEKSIEVLRNIGSKSP